MRLYARYLVGLFGLPILATMPTLAAGSSTHTDSLQLYTTTTMTFGTTQLPPGDYVIKGKESQAQLDILRNDNVVATVPCQWVRLDKKAQHSEVISTSQHVTEVQFDGRKEAAKIG